MFDRYAAQARREPFFARYEARQLGSSTIESASAAGTPARRRQGITKDLFADANLAVDDVLVGGDSIRRGDQKNPQVRRSGSRRAATRRLGYLKHLDAA